MARTPLLGTVDRAAGSVHLSVHLAAPPRQVWRALTEPDELATWLGRVQDGLPAPRAGFALQHDEATRSHHVVTDWEPERLLSLTWDFPEEAPSRLALALAPQGAGTRLVLTHRDLADPVAYAAGWHRHLEHLAAHLAGTDGPWEHFWDGYEALVQRYAAQA